MTNEEAIKWLKNLYSDIGQMQFRALWGYEQAMDEIIGLLSAEPSKSTEQNVADVPSGEFVIRDAVVDTILKTYTRLKGHPTANHLIENIDALPGADQPQGEDWDKYSEKLWRLAYERGMNARPKGEWIENDALGWKCSKCGIITNLESNFCPCCGARMKGGAE